jgi:very-short-patch-repair endonuclease
VEERLRRTIDALQGVARVSTLRDRGHSAHQIATAIHGGALIRVRRGWVAAPDADPWLAAAARHGVRVTCMTQARRLGLWTPRTDERAHVAAAPNAGHVCVPGAVIHWSRPLVARPPDSLIDGIENVLVLVAQCLPHEDALVVWESALRRGLVDREVMSRLPLPPAARRLCTEASPYSDSGLETIFHVRLRWLDLPVRAQIWIAGHHVDVLIGDRLVVQIDGSHHVGPQRTSDIAHDARLMLLGYHVIRVGYEQVVHRWHEVQELIMLAVGQGLHRA